MYLPLCKPLSLFAASVLSCGVLLTPAAIQAQGVGEAASVTAAAVADPVRINVNWDARGKRLAREAYSLNAFHSFNPEVANNPDYQANMAYINPGLLRYHNGGLHRDSKEAPAGWIDTEARTWDREKIRSATAGWPKERRKLVNIPSWPAWMQDEDRVLKDEYLDDYAALCAELVKILNIELGLGIEEWEPLNERELVYVRGLERAGKPTRFHDLVTIYNRCAEAMKAVDPTIKIGGPTISNLGWLDLARQFTPGALDNLDFFTTHVYVTNDKNAPDELIFDAAEEFGPRAAKLREYLDWISPNRYLPLSVNEFNINWTYHSKDPRMVNHKSAVFDALAMSSMLSHGVDSTLAWNDTDNIYGKMSRRYELFPSAHLYHVLNGHFIGEIVQTGADVPRRVVPFAVQGGEAPAMMLVNRTDAEQTALVAFSGAGWQSGQPLVRHRIDEGGYSAEPMPWQGGQEIGLQLPPFSVTLITGEPAAAEGVAVP